MNYPLLIVDEPHLVRLIRRVAKELKSEGTETPAPEYKAIIMSKQDVYKEIGRTLADRLIKKGEMKLSFIGGRYCIKRKEFDLCMARENSLK